MKFQCVHNNYNVLDLERSISFYKDALGLSLKKLREAEDGSFKLAFLGNDQSEHLIELTWLRDKKEPYNLGDNEIHLAFQTEDFEDAHQLHQTMGCICYENPGMGIYFISDPDGYWIEIIPAHR